MQIHEVIIEKAVLHDLASETKEDALREMIHALHDAGRLSQPEIVLADVLARERSGTSGIGDGLAIPHVCSACVHQPMIAVGFSRKGLDFRAVDDKPVHMIFMVLGRLNGETHNLKILGRIARLLNIPELRESIAEIPPPAQLIELIKGHEEAFGDIDPPKDIPTVCVAGAGHGGVSMAGHLALGGCRVNLFNRSEPRLHTIRGVGGVQMTGEVEGFARLNLITTDPGEAISGVDLIMVVVPATGHLDMARMLGPHLSDGQVVVLNPGGMGGALEFAEVTGRMGIKTFYFLAETETLIYACRMTNPGQARIFRIKNAVPVSTFPAYHITDVLGPLRKLLPYFVPGDNVLKTSLSNISAVFHPALTMMNAAWIEETKGNFEFYLEGASSSVARILQVLDSERVKVAEALGVRVLSAREWLYQAYGAVGDNLYDAMQANDGYRGIKAPVTLDHRYITEDVPSTLVPMASLAEQLGVEVPGINAIIQLAGLLHGVDYATVGRTAERLGLAGMSVRQIRRYVEEGRKE